MNNRIILIVIDSVGIGALPDAEKFGDLNSDTMGNIDKATEGLRLPNMYRIGLSNLKKLKRMKENPKPVGYYTRAAEASNGKDTLTGHWEMTGVLTEKPFKTFTEKGFPRALIEELEKETGHKFIGNYSASGTEILETLGEEHKKTKALILYTSADSVLQIAANEDFIPLEELYRVCEIARKITLKEEYKVGRIIARPFKGDGPYERTTNRHDYAICPPTRNILNDLKDHKFDVVSVGKINDIFSGEGITEVVKSKTNAMGMEATIAVEKENKHEGLVFVNLVDFDSLYGHRRDAQGYKESLEAFDSQLGELMEVMDEKTLLIITADHGNDPTFKGTDHTREWVPVLVYSKGFEASGRLDDLKSFADLGMTILDNFGINASDYPVGKSFYQLLK